MRRGIISVWLFLAFSLVCGAQDKEGIECILKVAGLSSEDELGEEEYERYQSLLDHPLCLNHASVSELSASGLFTPYQIASLDDYRKSHGDIVSLTELAAVDGFNTESVNVLSPFVSLTSHSLPGTSSLKKSSVYGEVASRTAGRLILPSIDDDLYGEYSYGARFRVESRGRFRASLGFSRPYSSPGGYPSYLTGSFEWSLKKRLGRVLAGDFNARFGQGLALWSGSFMNTLTEPSSFMKKSTGLSASQSFTGSTALTGTAVELNAGRFLIYLMGAFPQIKTMKSRPEKVSFMPAANLAWLSRYGKISTTLMGKMPMLVPDGEKLLTTSVDASFCVRGVNLFGEFCTEWVDHDLSALAGVDFKAGDGVRGAALVKYSRADLMAAALSASYTGGRWMSVPSAGGDVVSKRRVNGALSALLEHNQMKFQTQWEALISDRTGLRFRFVERLRKEGARFKSDLRLDWYYESESLGLNVRVNPLKCEGWAFLSYLEGRYSVANASLYLRQGVFVVDDWDDRIYVYERDAPGSFNVPAMYGRGLWTSMYTSVKLTGRLKFYVRAQYLSYVLMEEEKRKPGKAELKFQLSYKF